MSKIEQLEKFRDDSYSATYSPDDDKLRLYVGHVPRECYDILRELGFVSTPKQDCDFVAVWTEDREDACYALIPEDDDIGDEDYSMADRAADRAERFEGYRDKRRDEAHDFADRYDEGPSAFGNQNRQRAERQAAKHERLKTKGLGQWGKAEYWQHRTAGVIANALHRLDPGTRRGRILVIEKEIRAREERIKEWKDRWSNWEKIAAIKDTELQDKAAQVFSGIHGGWFEYFHPDDKEYKASLYTLMNPYENSGRRPITDKEAAALYLSGRNPNDYINRTLEHLKLRLEYENAMLENEGGKASEVEMKVGGFIGNHRIYGINKSPKTGRVVSVKIKGEWGFTKVNGKEVYMPHADKQGLVSINIERLGTDAYRDPTEEEMAAFIEETTKKKAAKKEAKKNAPPAPKLINPTLEDAKLLQEIWNEEKKSRGYQGYYGTVDEPAEVTQAKYSSYGTGEYSPAKTVLVGHDGRIHYSSRMGHLNNVPVFKVRRINDRVVVLTDKPQSPIPWAEMDAIEEGLIPESEVIEKLPLIQEMANKASREMTNISDEDWPLFTRAVHFGYVSDMSMSQKSLTKKAYDAMKITA